MDAREARPHTGDDSVADAALRAQLAEQLLRGDLALEPLPRSRAPHSTIDLDEEITNIVARPAWRLL